MIDRDAVLISFMSLLPAILASPVAVATIERAFEWRPRWQAILLAALAPAVLVGLSLWLTARSTTLGRYGALSPDAIPKALPLMLPAAAALGVLLLGRSFIGKAVITGFAILLAAGGLAAFGLARNALPLGQPGLFEADLHTLAWKIPIACAILLAIATYCAVRRQWATRGRNRIWLVLGTGAFLLWLMLRPDQFPSTVPSSRLYSIGGARLSPRGDLFLTTFLKPVRTVPWARAAFVVLRSDDPSLQVLSRRPVVNISIFGLQVPHVSEDGKTLASVELATPIEAFLGRPFRVRLLDTATGRAFVSRLGSTEEASGGWLLDPQFLGPDHSWATEITGKLTCTLPNGQIVSLTVDQCNSTIWESGSDLRVLTPPSQSGVPFPITTVSLSTGSVKKDLIEFSYDHSPRVVPSPDGRTFLIEGSPYGHETPWYLVDSKLHVSRVSSVPAGSRAVAFWQSSGLVSVVEEERLLNVLQGATTMDLSPLGLRIEMQTIDGVPLALIIRTHHGTPSCVFQLEPSLDGARLVADRLIDFQWLADSIVYVQASEDDQRIIRWYPRTGKSEVLLTVPSQKEG